MLTAPVLGAGVTGVHAIGDRSFDGPPGAIMRKNRSSRSSKKTRMASSVKRAKSVLSISPRRAGPSLDSFLMISRLVVS